MFGLKPARTFIGRIRDRVVTAMLESSMKGGAAIVADLRAREGLPPYRGSLFDFHVDTSELILQVGVPGMDYPRTDWPANVRFVGPMVPHEKPDAALPPSVAGKLDAHPSLIVVSQGTLDNRDPEKLFVPALTALAGTPHLVVATTGGRSTSELRERFPQDNVVVEDWIDFGALMRHADLFISNGGYGSVMRALVHGVPLLVAGKLEGKADINARLDYHGLALDLRTERPTPKQIARGVARVLGEPRFAQNVARVRDELASYDSYAIVEAALTAGQARPVARAAAP
ncbi:MAG: hypothetical protein M5U28_47640 [Sandaracinaceae bacterium]|nr:hypothetical protein [Sandaracinaceae bacterium]